MSRLQRIELLLFGSFFFAFAYFNQGGGWNQNARFAEVRALVEEGRFPIDNYLVYRATEDGQSLQRLPLTDATYTLRGQRFRLCWVDMVWNLFPVGDHPLEADVQKAPMVEVCASGDIAYVPATGHFHPNKPPGTSFLGVPAYFIIFHLERWLGIDPNDWWTIGVNAWLTTVGSVGLLSALAGVVFFRLAHELARGATTAALLATITFALGTTFFPFATLFFDHTLTASLLLISFYFLRAAVPPGSRIGLPSAGADATAISPPVANWRVVLAGLCAGLAAITNYVAAVATLFLGLFALLASGAGERRLQWRRSIFFALGLLPPFFLICFYGDVCFGSPFKLNTDFQNPLFKDPGGALGMFTLPNPYVAALLLASPFRGLFFFAPVLLLGVCGLFIWLRNKEWVPEARLCCAIFGFFFLVNVCFNGYHGGFSAGPRYLVPGLPFLALPLVVAFASWPFRTAVLAIVSIGNHLVLTVTDAQNPVGVGGHARVEGRRSEWGYNLLADYAWPLFAHDRAWPLLEQQLAVHMEKEEERIAVEIADASEREKHTANLQRMLRESIARGEMSPFLLATVEGPVSVNPIGIFEGLFTYGFFPPHTPQTRWASFNIGEFFFPRSRWSVLPLLAISGGLLLIAARLAPRDEDRKRVALHEKSSEP